MTTRLHALHAATGRLDACDGDDADPDGRLLSVSEIQQALRELRAHRPGPAPGGPAPSSPRTRHRRGDVAGSVGAPVATQPWPPREDTGGTAAGARADRSRERRGERGDGARRRRGGGGSTPPTCGLKEAAGALPAAWVTVVAAHAGAGASTVALALSDAAAAADRRVHLLETAAPARSGLVAAAPARAS